VNRRLITLFLAVAMAIAGMVSAHSTGSAAGPAISSWYLSLGDSQAYGYQDARFKALLAAGKLTPTSFNTGYADDLFRMMKTVNPTMQMVNYGCPGETTTSFLSTSLCSGQFYLHNQYTGSQLAAALAFLQAHPGQVNPITIDIGANDILGVVNACGGLQNLQCVVPKLPDTITGMATNLGRIVGAIRQAAPTATIMVAELYNPFAAADQSTNSLATPVNAGILAVTKATGTTPVDMFAAFNAPSPQPQRICALTLMCPGQDLHPTDAGYLLLAQQFWKAPGGPSTQSGFMAGWNSTNAGQGMILFGPTCSALVMTATNDLQPTSTTAHQVYVTGNDFAGGAGDNGILPNTTYFYATETISSSGVSVDNNGGKCYTAKLAGVNMTGIPGS